MNRVLLTFLCVLGTKGFLTEGPASSTEASTELSQNFRRPDPGLRAGSGGSRTWPLYHTAPSVLTVAGLTLLRRYQGQVGKDKKIPRGFASTPEVQSHSHAVPIVDETGCGRHYLDYFDSGSREEDGKQQACRRYGRVRTLPNFRTLPKLSSISAPLPLESTAGDLLTCDTFDPVAEMSAMPEASSSLLELGCLFNSLRSQAEEGDFHFIEAVTDELNVRYKVGLTPADAQRIYDMLSKHGKQEISCENFMQTLRDLLSPVLGSNSHLSIQQLRVVMATAFERFDKDGNGHICVEEFACALRSYDIRLGPSETMLLFRFLSPDDKDALIKEDLTEPTSFTDRCQVALQGAQEKAAESTGLRSASKVLGSEHGTECWIKRIQGAISGRDGPEILTGAVDLATSSMAASLALMHAHMHPHDAGNVGLAFQCLEQLRSAVDNIFTSVLDVVDSGCLLPLLISSFFGALKSLAANDLVALDQNEALLYALNFHDKGCSTSLFQRLLSCGGCRWGKASAGQTIAFAQELRIIIRGRALRKFRDGAQEEELGLGAVLQSSQEDHVIATEAVTFVAWDMQKLYQFIRNAQDHQLVKLVDEMMQDASLAVEHRTVKTAKTAESEASDGWTSLLSPVGSALGEHCRRKGFVHWVHLLEGLRHILEKDASAWEKMDKCRSLVLDSAGSCFESVSALCDLFGAASVLKGWSQTQQLSPDDMVQLAPIMVLSALVACRAAGPSGFAGCESRSCDSWHTGGSDVSTAAL